MRIRVEEEVAVEEFNQHGVGKGTGQKGKGGDIAVRAWQPVGTVNCSTKQPERHKWVLNPENRHLMVNVVVSHCHRGQGTRGTECTCAPCAHAWRHTRTCSKGKEGGRCSCMSSTAHHHVLLAASLPAAALVLGGETPTLQRRWCLLLPRPRHVLPAVRAAAKSELMTGI